MDTERSASSILPSAAEAADLVAGPGSMVRRIVGDGRGLAGAGYALVLQVAHPTVAAGVRDHSSFREDPWGRLQRTRQFVNTLTFGTPEEARWIGRHVREMHRSIKGTAPDGERYHSMDPEAFAWVHASLGLAMADAYSRFGKPMTAPEQQRFWVEWRKLGRFVGVRDRDLPGSWSGARAYFDGMVADTLRDNDVVAGVLDVMAKPPCPPGPAMVEPAWRLARIPPSAAVRLCTSGLMPPQLRETLGVRWTPRHERACAALARTSRALTPVVPLLRNVDGPVPGFRFSRSQRAAAAPRPQAAAREL